MAAFRRIAGLIAAILLIAMGGVLAVGAPPPLGIALLAVGLGAAVWQAHRLYAERRDPYDLSRLWETEPERPSEPDEEEEAMAAGEDDGTLYCHSCGHAVPRQFHFCPGCRRQLT